MKITPPRFVIDDLNQLVNKKSSWNFTLESNATDDPLLKYNNCVTYLDCREINPDVMNDLDENGAWNYRLDNLEVVSNIHEILLNPSSEELTLQGLFYNVNNGSVTVSPIVIFNADLPKVQKAGSLFFENQHLEYIKTSLPSVISTYPDSFSKYVSPLAAEAYMLSIPLIPSYYPLQLYVDLDLPNAGSIEGILSSMPYHEPLFYFQSLKINAPKVTSCIVIDLIDDKEIISTPFRLLGDNVNKIQSIEFNAPSLKNGYGLFGDTRLEEFSGDLSSLLIGEWMFIGCHLSLNSVRNIANCINDISEKPWDGSNLVGEMYRFISDYITEEEQLIASGECYGQLTLHIGPSLQGTAELEEALEAIRAKGWTTEEYYD